MIAYSRYINNNINKHFSRCNVFPCAFQFLLFQYLMSLAASRYLSEQISKALFCMRVHRMEFPHANRKLLHSSRSAQKTDIGPLKCELNVSYTGRTRIRTICSDNCVRDAGTFQTCPASCTKLH